MRAKHILVFLILSIAAVATGQPNPSINVDHYRFELALNDSTNNMAGMATITLHAAKPISEFELNLVNNNSGKGMTVSGVTQDGKTVSFVHQNNRLRIALPKTAATNEQLTVAITYSGIPADGLIIGRNKFNDRTFFGDNWPDRARHWLPTVDHPSDKATCEFIVKAPSEYQVISNGRKVEESWIDSRYKTTHWIEGVEIPTKVMVIGVARFAISESARVNNIPVESWVYPQNRTVGFATYEDAKGPLEFFSQQIGPYSYEKLANVQSTTRYGGMENASAIFYAENSLNGKEQSESLIAHETGHQWFGNSATEMDWHHVWLSEGFATYLANLYTESAHGHDALMESMRTDRQQVIDFAKTNSRPIIDTTIVDLMQLLNTNSYQKASWVLHMLRHEVGDSAFFHGLREYYKSYRNANALTQDFQHVMEHVSGTDLSGFFAQWLWSGGHPKLAVKWHFDAKSHEVQLQIDQIQNGPVFHFNLDLKVVTSKESSSVETLKLSEKSQKIVLSAQEKPVEISLDPSVWLLFEGSITAQ